MKRYKIVNTLGFGSILVQTIIWIILTLLTLGLALPFFMYFFFRIILNHTEIHEIEEGDLVAKV